MKKRKPGAIEEREADWTIPSINHLIDAEDASIAKSLRKISILMMVYYRYIEIIME